MVCLAPRAGRYTAREKAELEQERIGVQGTQSTRELYPKFDTHVHAVGAKAGLLSMLDALGIRTVLNLSYSGFREPDALLRFEDTLRVEMDAHSDRFRFAPSFGVTDFLQPGYADRVIAKLQRDVDEHGAVGVKIWKDLGMMLKDADGRYVFCDDARLLPIYDFIASKGLVIYSHIADPLAGWMPLDYPSPHAKYFRNHPEYHWYGKPDKPSHDEILGHRDALIARYPKTRFVGAHLASLEHDLGVLGRFLDAHPNAYVDTAARFADLTMKPNEDVRAFFVKYQDRILYGTDWEYDAAAYAGSPEDGARKRQACLDGYRKNFTYFEQTLALPAETLHKFYFGNAATLFALPAHA